jgi:hypothetical protein
MRLTEYGRKPQKRKASVHQPDLLLVGVDVRKAKHNACLGTQTIISGSCRRLQRLEQSCATAASKSSTRSTCPGQLVPVRRGADFWR